MEKARQFRIIGLVSGLTFWLGVFLFNPVAVEVYLSPHDRLHSFLMLLLVVIAEIGFGAAGWFFIFGSREDLYTLGKLRLFRITLLTQISVILSLCAGEMIIRSTAPNPRKHTFSHLEQDSTLGWKLKGRQHLVFPKGGMRWSFRTNEEGFRSERAVMGKRNIAFFGDGMTFGECVRDRQVFTSLLNHSSESAEVNFLNFGVPGYNPLQSLLMYRRVNADWKPDTVVLVISAQDDFQESASDPEAWYLFNRPRAGSSMGMLKITAPKWTPRDRFRKSLGEWLPESQILNYLKTPNVQAERYVPESAEDIMHAWFPVHDSTRKQVVESVIREFRKDARFAGQYFILVLVPARSQILPARGKNGFTISNRDDLMLLENWLTHLSEKLEISFLNLTHPFLLAAEEGADLYQEESPWLSAAGHELFASAFLQFRSDIGRADDEEESPSYRRLRVDASRP